MSDNRPWTPERSAQLIELRKLGLETHQLAKHFGVSEWAIQSKEQRIRAGCGPATKWSEEEVDLAMKLRFEWKWEYSEVAKKLERKCQSVRDKCERENQRRIRAQMRVDANQLLEQHYDRMRAAEDRRDLTASLMGDPLPGCSALDRYNTTLLDDAMRKRVEATADE